MTIDVDVRTQNEFSVTGVIYGKNKKLIGSPTGKVISIPDESGRPVELCRLGEVDDLIKALQAAKKLFGVL